MSPTETVVPALRDGVVVKGREGRYWIEDAARRLRVGVDEDAVRVIEELAGGEVEAAALRRATGVATERIWERVRLLNTHALLETPRAIDQIALHRRAARPDPDAALRDAPLSFPKGLRHACVACGACCHGTDVGPLTERDIAKVRERDWTPHLPEGVTPDDWIVTLDGPRGQRFDVLGTRHGRCVFLGDDKLCIIHREAGSRQKPTICQQFPYTFTRTPSGIDVSFSMECRAWWRAKAEAGPVEDEEAAIRDLIAQGGPVVELPAPVPLWFGLDLEVDAWRSIRDEAIEMLRDAPDVGAMASGLAAVSRRALEDAMAPYRDSEAFASPEAWGLPPVYGDRRPTERFHGACARISDRLDTSLGELRDGFIKAGEPVEADRADRVRWALTSLMRGRRVEDMLRWAPEPEVWRDMALASLYGHEPARRDVAMYGIALVNLRLLGGSLLAGMTAQLGLRGRTSEQDVGDALVLLTKELRGTAYQPRLAQCRRDLVAALLYNAHVFADGGGPIAPDPLITPD